MAQSSSSDLTRYYEAICQQGYLRTTDHARRWSAGVLKALGVNLDGRTKRTLAKALPAELAGSLQSVFWLLHFRNASLARRDFLRQAALRSGHSDPNFAQTGVTAVFSALKGLIPKDVQDKVADSLAPEIAELWRQAPALAQAESRG
jgi:uncharacterized protein (DUF2267 family)